MDDVLQYTVEFQIQGNINTKEFRSNLSEVSTKLIRDYLEHKRFVSILDYGVLPFILIVSGTLTVVAPLITPYYSLFSLISNILTVVIAGILWGFWWLYISKYQRHFKELQGIKILPMDQEDRSERSGLKYKKVKFILYKENEQ